MQRALILGILGATFGIAGCGGPELCEEPEFYEYAQAGKRIEAPDDLDGLSAERELVIPDASPRAARPPGSGCLDRPPTLRIDDDEDEEDADTES